MIKLNEYLGSIKSNIAEAKRISDIKSVEIAQRFLEHDVLKYFSIPRFKTGNVALTIPIAIGEMAIETKKRYTIEEDEFAEETLNFFRDYLRFPSSLIELLLPAVEEGTILLAANIKQYGVNDNEVEGLLKNYAMALIIKCIELEVLFSIEETTETAELMVEELSGYIKIHREVSKVPKPKVIVESEALKDIDSRNIVKVSMNIIEEPMEWQISEENGEIISKLLPE